MRNILALTLSSLLTGCATVGSMRSAKPDEVILSRRSVSELSACIVAEWDSSTFTLQSSVRPLAGGGSSLVIANGYGGTALLVDVREAETGSRIELFTSIHYVSPFISDVRKCAG